MQDIAASNSAYSEEGGRRRSLLHLVGSTSAQLAGGAVLSVLVPAALTPVGVATTLPDQTRNTTLGVLAALVLASYLLKRIVAFPGIREDIFIVPTFTGVYAAVIAVFMMLRLDYSRVHFVEGYVLAVVWFVLTAHAAHGLRRARLAVVPGGAADNLVGIAHANWIKLDVPALPRGYVSGIVADLRADLAENWERFIADCAVAGIPVYHFKEVQESLTGRVEIEHLSENNLGSLVPNSAYAGMKALVDWLVAAVALVVLAPVMLVIAVAVRLDTPGPALFRQERMGYRGKTFRCFKFRTMRAAAAASSDRRAAMTQGDDDRITRVGRFLRRMRLDELPQIFNILRGEMSWIGPRPEALVLSRWYEAEIPFYRYRHIVRPGISGWAQVNQGHVAELDDVTAKLHYDFFYIRNFSLWLDLLILMRTVATVFSGFGAK